MRAYLRYARMSVAMPLAETQHHSAQRQKKARAQEEEREVLYTAAFRTTVPPSDPELFCLFEGELDGERPGWVTDPAPQGAHRYLAVRADPRCACAAVGGMEQVVDLLRQIDAPSLDDLVFAVPKIFLDRIPQRCPRRRPRKAEQLVEVPTIKTYSSLQKRNAEQIIDIPVPHDRSGRGGGGGLQGFSQGQGSTACSGPEFSDIPVPPQSRGGEEVFSVCAQTRIQLLHPPALMPCMRLLHVFLRTFPQHKKSVGFGPHSGSELGADFSPWTPAACAESMAGADDEFEAEWEAEAEVEEDAATRFAAGFRPMRVCTRFLEHPLARPVWRCACGDRCTFAHSWAELHPEASAHEHHLSSYFPD